MKMQRQDAASESRSLAHTLAPGDGGRVDEVVGLEPEPLDFSSIQEVWSEPVPQTVGRRKAPFML